MDQPLTSPLTRVLERFVYEGFLIHNHIMGRRRRITLDDVLKAGEEEPRVLEVLPAILRLRPTIIHKSLYSLRQHPKLKQLLDHLNRPEGKMSWQGISEKAFRKQESGLRQKLYTNKQQTKCHLFNLRLSTADVEALEKLSKQTGIHNKSDIIRSMIHESSHK